MLDRRAGIWSTEVILYGAELMMRHWTVTPDIAARKDLLARAHGAESRGSSGSLVASDLEMDYVFLGKLGTLKNVSADVLEAQRWFVFA